MDNTMQPQDPNAAQPEQGEDGDGGYEICVKVDGSGQISVGVEDEAAEAAEDQGQGDDDSGYTPVPDIKAAAAMVVEIFKNGGKAAGTDQMSVEEAFNQGFNDTPQQPNGY
jgi:hypothetical protein